MDFLLYSSPCFALIFSLLIGMLNFLNKMENIVRNTLTTHEQIGRKLTEFHSFLMREREQNFVVVSARSTSLNVPDRF
jgi:hypothetical protein